MPNPVDATWFTSDMAGAPTLSGTAGELVSVLDACLINGFGSITLDSLVISSGIATATKSTGHGFEDHVVVLIEGATPSSANGEKRLTLVNATTFTFDAEGITDQTATGTITAKMAAAGWVKAFADTHKAVYRSHAVESPQHLLRVVDGDKAAQGWGYEAMTDIDTGTGEFAGSGTSNHWDAYFVKSNVVSTATRDWVVYADSRSVYFLADYTGWGSGYLLHGFGDLIPFKSGDAYAVWLLSSHTITANDCAQVDGRSIGSALARSYTQTGGSVPAPRYSHRTTANLGSGLTTHLYPSDTDNAFHAAPVEVWEAVGPRGIAPGLWNPLHKGGSLAHGELIDPVPQLPGHRLRIQRIKNNYTAAFDITGPWR